MHVEGLRVGEGGVLTLLVPQSRFGDKLRIIRVFSPHIWDCGSKRVKYDVGAGSQSLATGLGAEPLKDRQSVRSRSYCV